jgi:predicted nuclease of restriction endonuclease-like (RecB) superfamily
MKKSRTKPAQVKNSEELFNNISALIDESRKQITIRVNKEMTVLNWNIGRMINSRILGNKRAGYGDQIVATRSQQLTNTYGRGFDKSFISRMINFYKCFPDEERIGALSQQLSWSHFVELLSIPHEIQRDFYIELARKERWGVRVLRERIDSMLYERTLVSKKPDKLIEQELGVLKAEGTTTPDLVFRDPYILTFLGLKDVYSEQDLESSILHQLQFFIIELGTDFAFVARQKRIIIDSEDFRIDLLFFHRGLKRLVAIDLKLGKFKAAYKGQMELYLKWLDEYERRDGEDNPIGLILCAQKQQEQIELLELDKGHIRVAEYMTQLPSKEIFADKLQKAISMARRKA